MATILTNDGSHTLFSDEYGVTYHSKYGAVTESAHVFIAAGLRYKAVMQQEIAILEIGFGTGLNAMMTWMEAERRALVIDYTGVEMYPVSVEMAQSLNFMGQLEATDRHSDFLKLHEAPWDQRHVLSDMFALTKVQTLIETYTAPPMFDLIYFDAFAPQAQPELWTVEILTNMYNALKPEGALVTYCAQGEFKRSLKKAGFAVEALKGPPGKREMTRAEKMG